MVVNCPRRKAAANIALDVKKREPLTRLVGHDRIICSANANARLVIVNDTDVWVNANAVG